MRRSDAGRGGGIEELRRRLEANRAAGGGDKAPPDRSGGIEELRRRLEARREGRAGDPGARDVPEERRRIPWKAAGALVLVVALVVVGAWAWTLRPGAGADPAVPPSQEAGQEVQAPGQNMEPIGRETEPVSQDGEPAGQDGAYAAVSAAELFDALRDSAATAEDAYLGKPVELSGYLKNVDSGGRYIFVGADPDEWSYSLDSVRCDVTDGAQLDRALSMAAGDPITVRGRVVGVGEVLGCVLEIDEVV